ncbi:DNA/RNA non-specific endonuclease [Hymenobacter jeollabukensis]|uniref:DNA/RNA non-specific endonuclease n=1 Tax=Hymenobacter jeollabukensis TaxID=2025313 RepID=A0A5R8WXF3_9BACT|nr:DNA/RNA non-specific endonuclease [Hymenobacter jeollabukensis]TLM96743.1 DNA/RNA non-specific endonuclease [Hymenobacter jeollabukensis]
MRLNTSPLLPALLLTGALAACFQRSPDEAHQAAAAAPGADAVVLQTGKTLSEDFEAGSKGSYAAAEETLPSGRWLLDDALIGTAEQDHKHGQKALRLRGKGRAQMRFDLPAGAGRVRVFHASYGKDGAVRWQLWGSQDRGRSWQPVGSEIKVEGAGLPATIVVNRPGPLRLEIRKLDGGDDRLNIDDFSVEPYQGGTPPAVAGNGAKTPAAAAPVTTTAPATLPQGTGPAGQDDPLSLGNPSGATSSPAQSPNNYLMVKPQYTLSYSRDRGTPNWVVWHLSKAWMGSAPRQDDFRPDPALPRGWYQVTPRSYSGSGFDKGHNCPSADRSLTLDDNSATFLMTNMIPQAPMNNQRTWNHLEDYSRDLVQAGNEVYVLMGSYGRGGTGSNGPAQTLDNGHVTVPKRVWKVLVVLPNGSGDLQRIAGGQARLIAIDTPNDNSVDPDWAKYRTSVDAIEAATGLDLLSLLPVEAQARLEAQVDAGPTR